MSEITETTKTTLSTSDYIAALDQFDESIYDEIIKRINTNRSVRKSETARQIAELKKQLNELKAKSPDTKTYGQIANPDNPNEVYRTGGYPDWLKKLAKLNGEDIYNSKAMASWVKMKKSQ